MPARLSGRIDLIINGGYWLGAAAVVEWKIGVDAERRPLEEIAAPLASR